MNGNKTELTLASTKGKSAGKGKGARDLTGKELSKISGGHGNMSEPDPRKAWPR